MPNLETQRPSWNEYFLMMAKLAATRSTCLAFPMGAVIVKDRQLLATGYNGSPSGSAHCTAQGYCYPDLETCAASSTLPSRAVHAEANAIALPRSLKNNDKINLGDSHEINYRLSWPDKNIPFG